MKKWMILCLAALIALPGAAITPVYADENTSGTTSSTTSNTETSGNNSTATSDTYSTDNSSHSTDNSSSTPASTPNSGGSSTVTTTETANKPIISLIGDASVRMKVGTTFTDPGTTVQDDVYKDLSAKARYTFNDQSVDSIHTNTIGTYAIHYYVSTPDNRVADEVTRYVTVVAVGDYVDLSTIFVNHAYGMAYHGDYVYVAQRGFGISRVNLYSGKVETVTDSEQMFMAVALDSSGNLYYTLDSDSHIYKIPASTLESVPVSNSTFNSAKSTYFTSSGIFVYGLTIDAQDNIYYSDYKTQSIFKLASGAQTSTTVISGFSTPVQGFTMDPLGNFYAYGENTGQVYRIQSDALKSLPVSADDVVNTSGSHYYNALGMVFLPNGQAYLGNHFTNAPELSLIPVMTLNGSAQMTVAQGDTFIDPGVTFSSPYHYKGLNPVITYTLNGSSVSSIDTAVPGAYTIHYNASLSPNFVGKEVSRVVIIKQGLSQLTDVDLNRPFGMAYYNNDVYYTDYDRGLLKISTKTFELTQIAEANQVVAVALNKTGDLFYSKVDDNTIYKVNRKYIHNTERYPYPENILEDYSRQYYTLPEDSTINNKTSINGLAFDQQDRLYFTTETKTQTEGISSKILRLAADSTIDPQLVANYSTSAYGLTISPYGNLYVNVGASYLYEAKAPLLENLPISTDLFTSKGKTNLGYGIVFLPDLSGYTSSIETGQKLSKLKFLDQDERILPVENIPINSINLNQNTLSFKKNGSSQKIIPIISPDNATITDLIWKSSNPSIAIVQDGVVSPVSKGTAIISVYDKAQPDIYANINIIVKDADKSSSSSGSNDLKLSVDDGKGKTTIPSTATIASSVQANGQMQDQITFDSTAMLQAINTLKNAAQETVRLVVPNTNNLVTQTNVLLPLNVSQDLKFADMNLEISTNNVKLSVSPSSLNNINSDIYFNFIPLTTTAQQNEVIARAKQQKIVKDVLGDGTISVVGSPITIETNLQNRPVQLVIPINNSDILNSTTDNTQWLQDLRIFIEHSDGDHELVQPTVVSSDDNQTGLQFTVNKFSTFTIVDMNKLSTSNTSSSTGNTNNNSDNATSGTINPAYIQGYPDKTFRPDQGITRAEMASLLYRLQATGGTGTSGTANYSDISSNFWAKQAIASMQSSGLMKGRTSTTFAPAQLITRAEMAAIVSRWQGLSGTGSSFANDINGNWTETDIKRVVTAGLMQGITPASFQPNQPLTRAQAVTILNKILEKTANLSAGITSWTDVPSSHWAYSDIMEASNSYTLK